MIEVAKAVDSVFAAPGGSVVSTAALDSLVRGLLTNGLGIVLCIVGGLLLTRFIQWMTSRITGRIDRKFEASDELVRSESSKHSHAVAQVIAWVAIAIAWIILALQIAGLLNLPIAGLVAPATVIGAALGFGAQRIVQDLLAGFFLITEKQYGFGDVVKLTLIGNIPAEGTVEDVTLRVTRLRSGDGEAVAIPNGQITKVVNLSKDWARAVVDIPLSPTADIARATEVIAKAGEQAFEDPAMHRLMLDEPTSMGVVEIEVDSVTLRTIVRTLPGKQFDVSNDLRARILRGLARAGITVATTTAALPFDKQVTSLEPSGRQQTSYSFGRSKGGERHHE